MASIISAPWNITNIPEPLSANRVLDKSAIAATPKMAAYLIATMVYDFVNGIYDADNYTLTNGLKDLTLAASSSWHEFFDICSTLVDRNPGTQLVSDVVVTDVAEDFEMDCSVVSSSKEVAGVLAALCGFEGARRNLCGTAIVEVIGANTAIIEAVGAGTAIVESL